MPTAYVSLHTGAPHSQLDQEVFYAGYKRLPVEYGENFGTQPVTLTFPVIEQDSADVVTYIAVGACERGQGEIFMRVPALPNIKLLTEPNRLVPEWWMQKGMTREQAEQAVLAHGHVAPRICICNSDPVKLPDNVNPIARIAHQLVYAGLMKPDDLHPKLFEAINDALHNAGVPVLKVERSAAAKMDATLENLRLSDVVGNA